MLDVCIDYQNANLVSKSVPWYTHNFSFWNFDRENIYKNFKFELYNRQIRQTWGE